MAQGDVNNEERQIGRGMPVISNNQLHILKRLLTFSQSRPRCETQTSALLLTCQIGNGTRHQQMLMASPPPPIFFFATPCFGILERSSANQFSWSGGVVLTDPVFVGTRFHADVSCRPTEPHKSLDACIERQAIDKAILSV